MSEELIKRGNYYLRALAPHIKDREAAKLMRELVDALERVTRELSEANESRQILTLERDLARGVRADLSDKLKVAESLAERLRKALELSYEYLRMAKDYGPAMGFGNTTIDDAIDAALSALK